jgi:hypothetical protein
MLDESYEEIKSLKKRMPINFASEKASESEIDVDSIKKAPTYFQEEGGPIQVDNEM